MASASLRFGKGMAAVPETSDAEFLAALKWRQFDGSQFKDDVARTDLKAIGLCWKQQAAERFRSRSFPHGFATLDVWNRWSGPAHSSSILRHLPDADARPTDHQPNTIGPHANSSKKRDRRQQCHVTASEFEAELLAWLDGMVGIEPQTLLTCCEVLLFQSERLSAQTVGRLWMSALSSALRLSPHMTAAAGRIDWDCQINSAQAIETAILGSLLPWVCGLLFDEVKGAPKLAKAGRKAVIAQLAAATDSAGAPTAAAMTGWSVWMRLWTDALTAACYFDRSLWKSDSVQRFSASLSYTATLTSPSGKFQASAFAASSDVRILTDAAALVGVPETEPWLRSMVASARCSTSETAKCGKAGKSAAERPGWQSDGSRIACLRTDWSHEASLATVLYHQPMMSLTLSADGIPLLTGPWEVKVSHGGISQTIEKLWECVCWYSDKDVDYVEWLVELGGGLKLARHLLLSRKRQFALLSDVATGATAERIDLTTRLPLVPHVQAVPVPDSREWQVELGGRALRVFPLALPQDPGMGTAGCMEFDQNGVNCLELRCASGGGGAFSPIVLDWSPKRRGAECEWRSLTVTEAGVIDPTAGRGFRLLTGKHHLVVFRSLRPSTRYRTVLGYQTWYETVVGQLKGGEVDPILLVEQ